MEMNTSSLLDLLVLLSLERLCLYEHLHLLGRFYFACFYETFKILIELFATSYLGVLRWKSTVLTQVLSIYNVDARLREGVR